MHLHLIRTIIRSRIHAAVSRRLVRVIVFSVASLAIPVPEWRVVMATLAVRDLLPAAHELYLCYRMFRV